MAVTNVTNQYREMKEHMENCTAETKWFDVEKEGLPQGSGVYICITRGAISLKLMKYKKDENRWSNQSAGGISSSVTHWTKIPTVPAALKMNILLKKASSEGIDDDEKLELAQLLKADVK